MNIEKILETAEHESTQAPTGGPMPPATWPWSEEVIDALKAYDAACKAHTERWDALQDAIAEYHEAAQHDQVNRRRAAREGKKDPGLDATEKAARALEFATFGCQEARTAANRAWPGDLIAREAEKRQAEFARELAARIDKATENYNTRVAEARALIAKAEAPLNTLRSELIWAGTKFSGMTFGTVPQGYADVIWPTTANQHTERWHNVLRFFTDRPTMTLDNSFDATYADGTRQ